MRSDRLLAALLLSACGSEAVPAPIEAAPPPSDERFLAARAAVETRLLELFEQDAAQLAPDPEGSGSASVAQLVGSSPDPTPFAAAGMMQLPVPTPKLARCHSATAAALAAFATIDGPALGEGKMGGPHLSPDEAHREVSRQHASIVAAYCLWREAARVCNAEAPALARFEPRFLACDEPAGRTTAGG